MKQAARAFFATLLGVIATATCVAQPLKTFRPDRIVNAEAFYPEGPQLIADGLLTAEMPKNRIVLTGPKGTKTVWEEAGCGPTSVKRIPSGGYWVLCHLGHHVVRLDERFATVKSYNQTMYGRPISYPNDSSVDAAGNLYLSSAGLFSLDAPASGRVVFIPVNGEAPTDVVAGLRYTNGVLVQEKLGRVLVSEHLNRRVLSFPLLGPGKFGEPSVFFELSSAPAVPDAYSHSGPDGLAAFADGDICVADYGNGRIMVLSTAGKYRTQIPVKLKYVTNMAISADQKSLFITMTRDNTSEQLDGVVQKFLVERKD